MGRVAAPTPLRALSGTSRIVGSTPADHTPAGRGGAEWQRPRGEGPRRVTSWQGSRSTRALAP
jgi:hypothetical protein